MSNNLVSRLWGIWCASSGIIAVAGILTAALFWGFARKGPVIVVTGPPYNISERVPVGGRLSYTVDFIIFENCPGEIVGIYRSSDRNGAPELHVQHRPASFVRPQSYPATPISRDIPKELGPGRWQFTAFRESACPTRRQVDQFVHFEFDVVS